MANIAEAAGMSRPALYQYFRNKTDIFSSAFVALIDDRVDLALAALEQEATVGEQLDGLLQRYEGDLWEQMAASPHSDEIVSAKNNDVLAGVELAVKRLWAGCASYLDRVAPHATPAQRADWVDVLHFSPKGFKFDQPSIKTYRRRLAAVASSIATEIESTATTAQGSKRR